MIRRPTHIAILFVLAAAFAGCATPRSHFYALAPTAAEGPAGAALPLSVGPVSVPGIVDRPQIVVRTGENRVFIDEFHRWGAPLEDQIARVVAGNLASLLGTARVTAYPDGPPADGAYRILVEVLAFDSAPGDAAELDAVWTVRRPGGGGRSRASMPSAALGPPWPSRELSGRTTVREAVRDGGYAGLAAAHSRALEKLCVVIADAIRSMEREGRTGGYPSMPSTRISRNR